MSPRKPDFSDKRLQCRPFSEPKRKRILEEHQRHVARSPDDVRGARLFGKGPQRACPAVDGEQPRDRVRPELEILPAGEQDAGHASRSFRRERGVVDVALVHHERDDTLRFPRDELVVEFAAGRHTPQQERRGREFGMLRSGRERCHRVQHRLSAALRHVDVLFDEALIVRLVGEPDTDQRQLVAHGECLPDGIVHLTAPVAVRPRNQQRDRLDRADAVGQPQLELRLVEVAAGRNGFLEGCAARLRARGRADEHRRDQTAQNSSAFHQGGF